MAEEGDGAASKASEWENREREEQLALLRETGGGGTRRITVHFPFVTLYFLLVFYLSFICHTTSGGRRAEAST